MQLSLFSFIPSFFLRFTGFVCLVISTVALSPMAQATPETKSAPFQYEVLTQRQDVIWGFDFLEDGRILFTERKGTMAIFDPRRKGVFP
ncbi:MAG: hypothetical protein AAGB31_13900, partial [Bdellovibrio sp.]